ncbi:prevent-host-death protein [Micromonospora taraxaci]|uniref:type II toxin-antitoxin system Phd/YefM family antitoxin n=1 Tax=Micromonospora taraxaci TaxID=1316803 RepID=UPI0033E1E032
MASASRPSAVTSGRAINVERGEEILTDRAGTPVAKAVPLVRRANRTAVGFLAEQVDLSDDWDSPQTNAEIAADFGIGG